MFHLSSRMTFDPEESDILYIPVYLTFLPCSNTSKVFPLYLPKGHSTPRRPTSSTSRCISRA